VSGHPSYSQKVVDNFPSDKNKTIRYPPNKNGLKSYNVKIKS